MHALIVAARTVHFGSAILVFGEFVLALFVAAPVWRATSESGAALRRALLRHVLVVSTWALAASVVSALAWLAGEASTMSGKPLSQAIADGTLLVVLRGTLFGRITAWRLGLALALGAALVAIARSAGARAKRLAPVAAAIAAAYIATLAWSGHAAAAQASGAYAHLASDVAHLIAAGAWVGALPGFAFLLGRAPSIAAAGDIARRFSSVGVVAVAALVASGVGNTWYLVGDVPRLIGTDYGRVLLVKIALFVAMLAIAAVNRGRLTPRLAANGASGDRARRRLRRNAGAELAIGAVVIAIVGTLGVMVPGMHQSPVWPFAYTLSTQAMQSSLGTGVAVVATGIAAGVAALVAIGGIAVGRVRIAIAALAAMVLGASMCASLLAVPAYPTTYAQSPVPYTTAAVDRGARIYRANCAMCHGMLGRGDGPAAASLPVVPADLAAHGASHRPGEVFWWIARGIPRTPMPAFSPRLSDTEIWDLVAFVNALSDAAAATTLANHAQPWVYAIAAPDFAYQPFGGAPQSLRQAEAGPATLLVFYTLPQSLPYLRALVAQASAYKAIGLRVIAIALPGSASLSSADLASDSGIVFASAPPDAIATYAMFARRDADPADARPAEADYLIDRQGYLRARWIGVPDAPAARAAEAFDEAERVSHERQRAPAASGHMHAQ